MLDPDPDQMNTDPKHCHYLLPLCLLQVILQRSVPSNEKATPKGIFSRAALGF
jgi:hypothetical protein